jgi:hypothetical protein
MKLLPEFQIYLQSKKKPEDNISLYLRADLSPGHRACAPLFDNSFLNLKANI